MVPFGPATGDETKSACSLPAHLCRRLRRMELLADLTRRLLEGQDPDEDVLPALFSVLSEELGVDASISYAVNEADDRRRDNVIRPAGIRAYACEPLVVGDALLGTLSFASRRTDAFEAEDIAFFRSVAHHIALAHERQASAATARETQRAQSFRLALTERLRDATDAQAMMDAATELLGKHLGVAQIGFAEFEDDGIHVIVHRDWNDGRIPSVTGRWRLADFGTKFMHDMLAGQTIVIPDVATDPRTNNPKALASYERIGARAILDIALVREGRMRAMLFTHDPLPRAWQPHEVHLVEETV